ncbi:TPA: hypothetical protein OTR37_002954 [Aeromonas dhakensis]|nr:hypothetical protein [Aeromonas dhakensis]
MYNIKAVSREEYRRLDNRVTCILQQRWPAKEISQWMRIQGQTASCGLHHLRRRHPLHASLALPAIVDDIPNPFQVKAYHLTVPVHSAVGRPVGRSHTLDGLTPVTIDQRGTIRCAVTGRTLFIAPGSATDRANLGAAKQLNPK